jgi:hypothetical protein
MESINLRGTERRAFTEFLEKSGIILQEKTLDNARAAPYD